MTYLDDYVKRVTAYGETPTESTINKNIDLLDREFETSTAFHRVEVNGILTDAIINRTRNFEIKKVHFRPGYEIVLGSVVEFEDDYYLITEKDSDEVYTFANMEQCNNMFKVKTGKVSELIGHKPTGEPVYKETSEYKEVPCIVRSRYYSTGENATLPLPDGKLAIQLQYRQADNIDINKKFSMYGKAYIIADIGYVGVIEGEGIMEISAERVANLDE